MSYLLVTSNGLGKDIKQSYICYVILTNMILRVTQSYVGQESSLL